jgi:Sulfotransferase family
MMAMAHAGFVFLAMPKTGSSVLQRAFGQHAQILVRQPPMMKHMSAARYERVLAPWLARAGYPRSSYETMCLVRDPVDRAVSWWKYRARDELSGKPNYTGEMSFAAFAEGLISGEIPLGTATNFVTDRDGTVIVDRIYRYENLDVAAAWMADKLGVPTPALPHVNVSPRRELDLDETGRARLEEFFAADRALYESAL